MIGRFQSVVVAAMLANRQAVAELLKDPVPNPTIVPSLDSLAAIIREVVAAYENPWPLRLRQWTAAEHVETIRARPGVSEE